MMSKLRILCTYTLSVQLYREGKSLGTLQAYAEIIPVSRAASVIDQANDYRLEADPLATQKLL